MRPTGTPLSRVRSPHSQSEGPYLIQAGETDNPIILADEPGYRSSSEDDRFLDWVDNSASPMRESPIRSNPDAKHAQRKTPTEIMTEAQAETPSQAKAIEQSSDLRPSVRRPSPPATQSEKGKARAVDSDKDSLADQQDKFVDHEIAEIKAQLKR